MASGCNAATGSVIGASGSYRTTIARAARRASSAVSAATIATGSPTYRTLPTARTGWSSFMSPKSSRVGNSAAVMIDFTPLTFFAPAVSMERIRACGYGLRRVAPKSMPSRRRSLPYWNSPFTFGALSGRSIDSPTPPRIFGRTGATVMISPRGRLGCSRRPSGGASSEAPGRCAIDRFKNLAVPRTAADVARERFADLLLARLGIAFEQCVRRDDEAGRAKPTLDRARFNECALHWMQPLVVGERFDSLDAPFRGRGAEHETCAHEVAIHDHRAGTALALLACVLAAGKSEVLAQDREEAFVVRRFRLALLAVDRQLDPHGMTATRASARAPITASTWRRYAAVPRTSSMGFAAPATSFPNSFAALSLGRFGRSQPASSRRPAANCSASVAWMIVGPHEPRPTPTRRRERSTTSASPATAMTIAFRVPTFMNVWAGPASSHSAATTSSSGRRTLFFGPVM